ncbi:MAG TPA: hypothetical protein VGO79_04085 [Thermoanaerobaculia bacterium]|jgi:hypothetical protein
MVRFRLLVEAVHRDAEQSHRPPANVGLLEKGDRARGDLDAVVLGGLAD